MSETNKILEDILGLKDGFVEQLERGAERVDNPLQLDPRTTDIIAVHFGLEREMELALQRLVARPSALNRLGFGHKVAVLKALMDNPVMDRAAELLLAFNELRNAAAHAKTPDLQSLISKLNRLLEEDGLLPFGDAELSPKESAIQCYGAAITGTLQMAIGADLVARVVRQSISTQE